VDDTIRLGIELRKKIRAMRREFEEKEQNPDRRCCSRTLRSRSASRSHVSRPGAAHNVAWKRSPPTELAPIRASGSPLPTAPGMAFPASPRALP